MTGIAQWSRDLLVSRGALVEADQAGMLRALLPEDVARILGLEEWLSLNFGPGAGADDPFQWTERLGSLLPADQRLVGARIRSRSIVPRMDTEAVLARELVVQNGVCRLVEDYSTLGSYLLFSFQYTVESDERNIGLVSVCLNSSVEAISAQPDFFLEVIRGQLEDDPAFRAPAETLARFYPAAARAARGEIRRRVVALEENANRRLARDTQRVESYYRTLLAQIEKRIQKRAADPQAADKERSRAAATELDRAAKLEDLLRKYSLRIQVGLLDVLVVAAPVREISVRLVRKKEERERKLHWNSVLHSLDTPLCEHCRSRAHPVYLCDKVHCLCKECWSPCPRCNRLFCPACQPRCKCGS